MSYPKITPVILCGGSGTRLWPLSRKSYPKQFTPLIGEHSLYQRSATRLTGPAFGAPMIVTNSDFRFIVTQQLSDIGVDPGPVLIEPEARNTASAVLAAALVIAQTDPDGLLLASPSDHHINDAEQFRASILKGVDTARDGYIVTLGVTPTRPETGYGYLELDTPDADTTPDTNPDTTHGSGRGTTRLRRFVEKPDADGAARMIATGRFLWNAGVFLCTARTLIDAFQTHAPDLLACTRDAVAGAKSDLGFLRLDPKAWSRCADISIDFAIMEKADNLAVVTHGGDWSDLGSWEAVCQHMPLNDAGVGTYGAALAIDCHDTLLRSEDDRLQLVGLGLDDIVAVAMKDAVLVAHRSRLADLGAVVRQMRVQGLAQADTFPRDFRPWGFFETLTLHSRFQVKRIVVNPGAALSLQSHVHRSEHWIVVAGTARVTVGDTVTLISENQSIYIPLGVMHRMENPGKVPLELIEVQTGAYLGEDDIIRYDDIYARG